MNLAKLNKILEKFWWTVAIITLVAVVYFSIVQGFEKWSMYFVVPVLAALMALMRRFMKNKLEKSQKQQNK
jgi:hypothetical protein